MRPRRERLSDNVLCNLVFTKCNANLSTILHCDCSWIFNIIVSNMCICFYVSFASLGLGIGGLVLVLLLKELALVLTLLVSTIRLQTDHCINIICLAVTIHDYVLHFLHLRWVSAFQTHSGANSEQSVQFWVGKKDRALKLYKNGYLEWLGSLKVICNVTIMRLHMISNSHPQQWQGYLVPLPRYTVISCQKSQKNFPPPYYP